jgi:uncharacterized UPF0160 family protein
MRICTHSGDFHADDVLAVSTLLEIYPDAEVVRSREPAVWDTCELVVDVGFVYDSTRGRFDHHQAGDPAVYRSNGIRYSGFGLVWKHFGRQICPDELAWAQIDRNLAMTVDAGDNGQLTYKSDDRNVPLFETDHLVKVLNPLKSNPQETPDGQFAVAVGLARPFLRRLIARETEKAALGQKLIGLYEAAADKRWLVSDEQLPVNEYKDRLPVLLYIVTPSSADTSWRALAVEADAPFTQRQPFPEAWRGLSDADLAAVTGVADAKFCHLNGFIVVAGSRAGVEQLVKLSLDNLDEAKQAKGGLV